jgi:lantibiotic biosynthesis protein
MDKKFARNTILSIRRILKSSYDRNEEWALNHKFGYILFLSEYFRQDRSVQREIYRHLADSFEYFNKGISDTSLFHGVVGLGWVIQDLCDKGIIKRSDATSLKEIDSLVMDTLGGDRDANNVDLFTGLIGKGVYLLRRRDSLFREEGIQIINQHFHDSAIVEQKSCYWVRLDGVVDLGLAHGVPSIISYLSSTATLHKGFDLKNLLRLSINYLLKQKFSASQGCYSLYPHLVGLSINSRLAWCYGDLGVAIAMHKANRILKSDMLTTQILEIINSCCDRKLSRSGVYCKADPEPAIDMGVCHGTMGLIHILSAFNKAYGLLCTERAIRYWLKSTVNHIQSNDDHLNVKKAYRSESEAVKWGFDPGLVEGLTGVGLVMLNLMFAESSSSIDSLLLMDL